jgi:hypothetical protein
MLVAADGNTSTYLNAIPLSFSVAITIAQVSQALMQGLKA